jgi:hypothetical protein
MESTSVKLDSVASEMLGILKEKLIIIERFRTHF